MFTNLEQSYETLFHKLYYFHLLIGIKSRFKLQMSNELLVLKNNKVINEYNNFLLSKIMQKIFLERKTLPRNMMYVQHRTCISPRGMMYLQHSTCS